jgi:hypothetical protein
MAKSKIAQPKVYPDGRFSRRHRTNENHLNAKAKAEAKVSDFHLMAQENAESRAKRSPAEQLAELDARLGKGQGAKRERARLHTLMGR